MRSRVRRRAWVLPSAASKLRNWRTLACAACRTARSGDRLDRGDEDGVLDEFWVAADHAHVRADGGQPPGASVELGRVADRAVFAAIGLVGPVDQPLDHLFAVRPIGGGRLV